jgi:hypothetical protein
MAKKSATHASPPRRPSDGEAGFPRGRRELVFIARPEAGLRAMSADLAQPRAPVSAPALADVLAQDGVTVRPLFTPTQAPMAARAVSGGSLLPAALAAFFHVEAPDAQLDSLAAALRDHDAVEAAYVKPAGEPPVELPQAVQAQLNTMAPRLEEPFVQSPDFSIRQGYLEAAPAGIDARFAWTFAGGRGAGVNVIDCEWGWRFTHEDLQHNKGGVVVGSASADDNHGTAVLGEFGGDLNAFGIIGLCSEAFVRTASFETLPTATVIQQAADLLSPGDLLLLEIHRPGPGASGMGQDGYVAIEWWPDDFAAIRYAVGRGIIVVEAGGNGFRNLDDALYDQPSAGFPASWRNPFNPANPNSGAIVVGAGAPPQGTHGHDHGPDRSRLDFSNHGSRIDVQGWGREVTTTGYGDLQGGSNADLWYTDQFSGTSSASPIVVGALGCVQGVLRARQQPLLTPETARQLLRTTGSHQQDAPTRPRTERIGNRPDVRAMLVQLLGLPATAADGRRDGTGQIHVPVRSGQVVINIRRAGVTINVSGEGED